MCHTIPAKRCHFICSLCSGMENTASGTRNAEREHSKNKENETDSSCRSSPVCYSDVEANQNRLILEEQHDQQDSESGITRPPSEERRTNADDSDWTSHIQRND